MALTPERIAELERLKALMQPLATEAQRKAQAIWNAEQMAKQVPGKKKGGLEKFLEPSKVKQRLYHGTKKDIKKFDSKNIGANDFGWYGRGHYLTADPGTASAYTSYDDILATGKLQNSAGHGANVMPLHVQARNPYYWPEGRKAATSKEESEALTKELLGLGHDSVIVGNKYQDPQYAKHHEVVLFDPRKIKSAIGNRGTYDINDPDITKAQGGTVNPFDYENPEHVSAVAGHAAKHKDFKQYGPQMMAEVLSTGHHQHLEDPRIQHAMRQAGHNAYHVQEKTGKTLHKMAQPVVKKAMGGQVQPSIAQMKMALNQNKFPSQSAISSIGAEEAPDMPVKAYVPPAGGQDGQLPVGGIDMSEITPGMQYMPEEQKEMQPPGQPGQPPQPPMSPSAGPSSPSQQSNILQMTPQGQAMAAMQPNAVKPQMASGGPVPVQNRPFMSAGQKPYPFMAKVGGSDNMPMDNQSMDNGATTFDIDNIQELAMGGGVDRYASKGYVHHTNINPNPEVGTRFKSEQLPGLMPEHPVNMDQLYNEKASLQLRPWDSTSRHVKVTGVSGHDLLNHLITEGGQGFARDQELNKEGIVGGSGREIQKRVQSRANAAHEENIKQGGRGHTYDIIANMEKMAPLFTHMPLHIQLDLLKQANLNPKEIQHIEHRTRTKKVQGKTPFTKMLSLDNPELMDQLRESGALRKALSTELASKANQKRLDYNLEDVLGAVTDPHIHAAPAGYAGNTFIANVPHAGLGPRRHTVYDTSGYGEYAGKGAQVPAELYMADTFDRISKELQKKYPKAGASAIRSMTIGALQTRGGNVSQMVNDRVMRNLERYHEGIRSGDIQNSNDLYGVLGHFYKKYGGYTKGGKVKDAKLSDNLDTMRLALTKKKAK